MVDDLLLIPMMIVMIDGIVTCNTDFLKTSHAGPDSSNMVGLLPVTLYQSTPLRTVP